MLGLLPNGKFDTKPFSGTLLVNDYLQNYRNAREAYHKGIQCILSNGEDDGLGNLEIINWAFSIDDLEEIDFSGKNREFKSEFAQKFFEFILAGGTDTSILFKHNPNVKRFKDDLASRNTAYGPRINAQLPGLIEELKRNPSTRRAVLTILHPDDQILLPEKHSGSKMEYPCTVSLIFLLRNKRLNLHVAMRSNNMTTTINYDLYNFICLQKWLTEKLQQNGVDAKLGKYFHVCASAHILKHEIPLAQAIWNEYNLEVK